MLKSQGQNINPRSIAEAIVANIPENDVIAKVMISTAILINLYSSSTCTYNVLSGH